MANVFLMWNNYDELHEDYLKNMRIKKFQLPFNPREAFGDKPHPDLNSKPQPLSEYKTFMYGVKKIQNFIKEEIKTLKNPAVEKKLI